MKDKKILVLVVYAGIIFGLFLFLTRPTPKFKWEQPLVNLKSHQLQDLVDVLVQKNHSLRELLEEEEEKVIQLKKNLAEFTLQNQALTEKLNQAEEALKLTFPIRERLSQINDSLVGALIKPQKKEEFFKSLRSVEKRLSSIERLIPELTKENISYKGRAETLSNLLEGTKQRLSILETQLKKERVEKKNFIKKLEKNLKEAQDKYALLIKEKESLVKEIETARIDRQNVERLQKDLSKLKAEYEQLNREHDILKKTYEDAQSSLNNLQIELGKRAERILSLGERYSEAEAKLAEAQLKFKNIERESAFLREQYLAVQLEREDIRKELEETKARLAELESRFQKASEILTGSKQPLGILPGLSEEKELKTPAKKVEVELSVENQSQER